MKYWMRGVARIIESIEAKIKEIQNGDWDRNTLKDTMKGVIAKDHWNDSVFILGMEYGALTILDNQKTEMESNKTHDHLLLDVELWILLLSIVLGWAIGGTFGILLFILIGFGIVSFFRYIKRLKSKGK